MAEEWEMVKGEEIESEDSEVVRSSILDQR